MGEMVKVNLKIHITRKTKDKFVGALDFLDIEGPASEANESKL